VETFANVAFVATGTLH